MVWSVLKLCQSYFKAFIRSQLNWTELNAAALKLFWRLVVERHVTNCLCVDNISCSALKKLRLQDETQLNNDWCNEQRDALKNHEIQFNSTFTNFDSQALTFVWAH